MYALRVCPTLEDYAKSAELMLGLENFKGQQINPRKKAKKHCRV